MENSGLNPEDKTLPLDPDASANITRFQDVTIAGETSILSDPGPHPHNTDRFSMMNGGGHVSPNPHSIKESSDIISQLKKENFRLKLRIFYMEEKIQQQFDGDQEDVFKMNIELKVECDSLKKELQDKNGLLIKATNAVASFENHPDDVEEVRQQAEREIHELKESLSTKNHNQQRDLNLAQEEIGSLSKIIDDLQEKLKDAETENVTLNEKLSDALEKAHEQDSAAFSDISDNEQNEHPNNTVAIKDEEIQTLKDDRDEKQRTIDQLRESLQSKQSVIEVLNEEKDEQEPIANENEQLKAELKERILEIEKITKCFERTEAKTKQFLERESEYQDHISQQQQQLDKFEEAIGQMSTELEKREIEVKDLKAAVTDSENIAQEALDKLEAKDEDDNVLKSKEIIMRDKAINGFTAVIRKKDNEIAKLKEEHEKHLLTIEELNRAMKRTETEKPVHRAKDELIVELRDQLKQQNDALQLALDEKMKSRSETEQKLIETENKYRDTKRHNDELNNKLFDADEMIKQLDSEIKEKDDSLQQALTQYKDMKNRYDELERARLEAIEEREELRNKFEEEKKYFAALTKKLQDQLQEQAEGGRSTWMQKLTEDETQLINHLENKIRDLELKIKAKDNKINELMKQLANGEQEKQLALDELELMISQRNDDSARGSGSRSRIAQLISAEVDRLRGLLRERDDNVQELEEKLLVLEGQLGDVKNELSIAHRKIVSWKDDGKRKDAAITELREALEDLSQESLSPDHHQVIKLTKENVEFRQLLKARESEIDFLKAEREALNSGTADPYIESLKREIVRKDKLLEDSRSRTAVDSSSIHSELDNVSRILEDYRRQLESSKYTTETLNNEIQQKDHWIQKLQDSEKAKDQLIMDLKIAKSKGKIPTVDSDEESLLSASYKTVDVTKKHKKRRVVKEETASQTSSRQSIRYTASSQNTMYTNSELQFTESECDTDHHSLDRHDNADQRTINSLKDEVEILREELNKLAAESPDKDVSEYTSHLREYKILLENEIEIYKNIIEQLHATVNDKDLLKVVNSLEHELMEVENLRKQLHELLLQSENCREITAVNSLSSTLLPHNHTSYLEIPTQSSNSNHTKNEISTLKMELETTRAQLSDAVREQADLQRTIKTSDDVREQTRMENDRLNEEIQQAKEQREMDEHHLETLRAEVDRLCAARSNHRMSDDIDTVSLRSGDESDGMSSLSVRELREIIENQRAKIINVERVNQLLKNQLKTVMIDRTSVADHSETIQKLSEEIKRLKSELMQQSHSNQQTKSPSKSRSLHSLHTKLPVPLKKNPPEDTTNTLRRALELSRASVVDLRRRNDELQFRLSATEQTVRSQSEKLKKHQSKATSALTTPPASPILPSTSYSDLKKVSPSQSTRSKDATLSPNDSMNASTQTSVEDSGYLSVSPRTEHRFNSLIQAQSKELSIFRHQLKKSRSTGKHLQTQIDVVSRYIDTLMSTSGESIDTMLVNGVTTELDRCRKLTKRLREQLAERDADTSLSDSDTDSIFPPTVTRSPSYICKQSTQWQKMVDDLSRKEHLIEDLESKLKNLQLEQERGSFEERYFKKEKISLPRDLLTPSTSQHSAISESESEAHCQESRSKTSGTEYQSLPDPQSCRSRHSRATYQQTTAVNEYIPDNGRNRTGSYSSQHKMTADQERYSTSYNGAWNAHNSATDNVNRFSNSTPTNQQQRLFITSPYQDPWSEKDAEIDHLKSQLNESERMNRSLQDELHMAAQHKETNTSFSSGYHTSRNPADILDEHLIEIRSLRQRLEASIKTNDLLREQLQRKLKEVQRNASENVSIFLPNEDLSRENADLREQLRRRQEEVLHLREQYEQERKARSKYTEAVRELSDVQKSLAERQSQTELLASHINQLTGDLQKANKLATSLEAQVNVKEAALCQLQSDMKELRKQNESVNTSQDLMQRLNSRCSSLEDQLNESQQLVKTLKSELDLYEKLHNNNASQTEKLSRETLDLSEFLSEIRSLRVQLEQSIEANSALRKQLEEQLKHSGSYSNRGSPARTTTINIHHLSPCDSSSNQSSPRGYSSRKKLQLDDDDRSPNHGLMTPPLSAHSNDPIMSGGFQFGSDDGKEYPRKLNRPYFHFNGPYVIGKYRDYAALKQSLSNGRLLVSNLDTKVKKSSPHRSSSHVIKELTEDVHNLSRLLDDSANVLRAFWPATFPHTPPSKRSGRLSEASDASKCTKDAGFASDSSVNSDADMLRREVGKLRKRLSAQDHLLQSTVDRLQNANKMKEGIEHAILQQLTVTHDVLKKARGNLEAKAKSGNTSKR